MKRLKNELTCDTGCGAVGDEVTGRNLSLGGFDDTGVSKFFSWVIGLAELRYLCLSS